MIIRNEKENGAGKVEKKKERKIWNNVPGLPPRAFVRWINRIKPYEVQVGKLMALYEADEREGGVKGLVQVLGMFGEASACGIDVNSMLRDIKPSDIVYCR